MRVGEGLVSAVGLVSVMKREMKSEVSQTMNCSFL